MLKTVNIHVYLYFIGTLQEMLGSYDASFYVSGAISIASCLVYMVGMIDTLPCKDKKKEDIHAIA